jgi:hypothetical protein
MLAARFVQFLTAVLAAYGASYGIRLNNLVFIVGLALTLLLTIAIFQRERNVLRALWPAVLGFSGLFAISGLPALGRPECSDTVTGASPSGCAGAAAHQIAVAALVSVGVAALVAVIDVMGFPTRSTRAQGNV